MNKLLLACAILGTSAALQAAEPKIKLTTLEVRSPNGALWNVALSGRKVPAIGDTIRVQSTHPQTREVFEFYGSVTAYKFEEAPDNQG